MFLKDKSKYKQGVFNPKNYRKYKGDPTNIIYRSGWELRLFKYLDENVNIISWVSEEVVVPYKNPFDNRYHRYFPDVLAVVKDKDGNQKTFLIEVKPEKQTKEPVKKEKVNKQYLNEVVTYGINQAKFEAAEKYAKDRGWEFRVITEKDLGI